MNSSLKSWRLPTYAGGQNCEPDLSKGCGGKECRFGAPHREFGETESLIILILIDRHSETESVVLGEAGQSSTIFSPDETLKFFMQQPV